MFGPLASAWTQVVPRGPKVLIPHPSVQSLGYIINPNGVQMDTWKLDADRSRPQLHSAGTVVVSGVFRQSDEPVLPSSVFVCPTQWMRESPKPAFRSLQEYCHAFPWFSHPNPFSFAVKLITFTCSLLPLLSWPIFILTLTLTPIVLSCHEFVRNNYIVWCRLIFFSSVFPVIKGTVLVDR